MNKGRANERERESELGGKRKHNLQHRGKQVTNIRTNAHLRHVSPDHACHLSCCVPWPAMSQKAHVRTLINMAAVFAWHAKTHSGPLANNSLSCSWNNSYCALWAYVSCHVYLCAIIQQEALNNCKQALQRSLFLTAGKWRWSHLPTAALPPPWRALGKCHLTQLLSWLIPHLPRVDFDLCSTSKTCDNFSWQHISRVTLTWNPFNPNRQAEQGLNLKDGIQKLVTVGVGWPTFEKGPSNCFTVSEEDYPVRRGLLSPTLEGTQDS